MVITGQRDRYGGQRYVCSQCRVNILSLCLPCPHIHFYTISSKSLHNPNRCLTFAAREPAKPLNDAQPTTNREQCQTCLNIAEVRRRKRLLEVQMCGSFYFYTMSNRIPFPKPYTSAHDLVSLLQSRGLTIADTAKTERYLEFIG